MNSHLLKSTMSKLIVFSKPLLKQKGKVLYERAFGKANIELNIDMTTENGANFTVSIKQLVD